MGLFYFLVNLNINCYRYPHHRSQHISNSNWVTLAYVSALAHMHKKCREAEYNITTIKKLKPVNMFEVKQER